jgi:WD40 repeat protein
MARWAPAARTDYFAGTGGATGKRSPALGRDSALGGRDEEAVGRNLYLKGCHWAPDGSCIAVNAADHRLRIFNTPAALLEEGRAEENEAEALGNTLTIAAGEGALAMEPEEPAAAHPPWLPVLTMPEGELIYDYAWYPRMSSEEPVTCRLFSSSRDHPVHAWDAFTGELAATYRNYDQFDAVTACHSLALAVDGRTLVCGLQSCVHIFDVARPGRHYQRRSTCRRRQGCKGFIASLTMSSDGGQYLCGGYSGQAALFCLRSGDLVAEVRAPTAVTYAVFANEDTSLVLGLRANPQLLHYDTRRMDRPVHIFHRRL